jgi:LPXTG-motif cell wall-anchored protein
MAGIGAASASAPMHGGGNRCARVGIEYSLDGGDHWTQHGRMDGGAAPTTITVRLTDKPGKKCQYNVSLASYSAEGPSWQDSGHQDFLGWDTVTLGKSKTKATLDVSQYAPTCFGQVDLYGNGIEYDGGSGEGHGALPHFPDSATPTDLITAWNGGEKCDQSPSPTPSATTDSPTPTPSDTTDSPTPTPSDTTDSPTPTPSATTDSPTPSPSDTTDSPSPSPSDTTDSPSPSASPTVGDTSSATPSATGPTSTAAPTGTPSVPPATGPTGGDLAETGGNGSQNLAFAGGGAALLVLGGAAVYFTRRRRSGTHS